MQHSPVRRSPRILANASDAVASNASSQTVTTPKMPAENAASTPTHEEKDRHQELTTPSTSMVSDMQKQIAALKCQLSDTQNKLKSSYHKCQQLQSALKSSQPKPSTSSAALQELSSSSKSLTGLLDTLPPISVSSPNLTNFDESTATNIAVSKSLPAATIPVVSANTSVAASNMPLTLATTYTNSNTTSTAAMSSVTSQTVYSAAQPSTQAATENFAAFSVPPTMYAMPPIYATPSFTQPSPSLNDGAAYVMPRKLQDLPDFSGTPEDWPIFVTAYMQSTAVYNYTKFENNQRLIKCLKGEAREVVKSLLIHPDNVDSAIEQLRFRFGRPEQLIQSQLRQVREMPYIPENNLIKLVPFATKIKNLSVFLQSVNGQQHIANPTLLEELVMKLPMNKKLEWAKTAAGIQPYPTIVDFSNWISTVASFVCTIQDMDHREQKRRVLLSSNEKQTICPICKAQHRIAECSRFLKHNVTERWTQAKKLRACFSCLNIGHSSRECRNRKVCGQNGCRRGHHKLLHEGETNGTHSDVQTTSSSDTQQVLNCSSTTTNKDKLLFRVLPVTLFGNNCRINIYALIDDGSSITMLDKSIADKLGVSGRRSKLDVQWFGGRSAQEHVTAFNIGVSGEGKQKRHTLRNVYAVSNLNLPRQSLTKTEIDEAFKSADVSVKPYVNVVPQLLIGLDHAHLGLPKNTKVSSLTGPIACDTKLGWVVYGPCRSLSPNPMSCLFANVSEYNCLHEMVKNYFDIESIGVRSAQPVESESNKRANLLLEKSTKRVGERFQTGLLWKTDIVKLPDNYNMAFKRLEGIENKMSRDIKFAEAYKEVVKGYIDKGYVRKLSSKDVNVTSDKKWYLPHFGVINPNKPKKIRLVFDAAAQTDGVSLNSFLLKGPQDIASLPNVIYNFRRGAVAVCADIREMFHQIIIQPKDRISQRFLWRNGDRNKPPEEFEMTVMTFGAACSPCSARYVLKENANNHKHFHPRAIEAIVKHHYIDDFVDSFETIEEAVNISEQVRRIHKNGGFDLRGFTSNCLEVITALDGGGDPKKLFPNEGLEKVLGVYWDPSSDTFKFNLKFNKVNSSVISGEKTPTKRELLSVIMSTFDPLGFLNFYTVSGKLILREVWRRDCRWDEEIPDDLNNSWNLWRAQMEKINIFFVPRCYFPAGKPNHIQLHIFVDASQDAFCAVAYWRYVDNNGQINIRFVASKTKSAPLKAVSIPRLELQAAVLGVRLRDSILEGHEITPEKSTFWTDSKTVIRWISSSHRRYKQYVAHRVAEILATTEENNWQWIPTHSNVADDATRFSTNANFSPNSRWLMGPDFLRLNEDRYGFNVLERSIGVADDDDEELMSVKTCLIVVKNVLIDFSRFSSFSRIKRTMAWVHRFINQCRKKCQQTDYGLSAVELDAAERTLIVRAQAEGFPEEVDDIKNGKPLQKSSSLRQLTPYVDDEGLLRVYGRIEAASFLPYSTRKPIILPSTHALSQLVVHHYHCRMKHQYHEATIGEVRKKFWIPHIRRLLKRVVSTCMVCRSKLSSPRAPLMGSLPRDRLEAYTRPFKNTGLDYFGPLSVSVGRRCEKRWVALFTCLTVRAIHLELAHDLSTDSCIIAMRNFMNRRGVPARIRSDNGKNFVGASEEAKRFSEVFECGRIQDELSGKGVEWIFNCPLNPSEGGVWERMVQSVKRVLRDTLKEMSPKEHVLQSLLIEAESIVNSRPLTHLPIEPDEEEPLTPNHFLIGYGNVAQCVDEPNIKLCTLKKQWRVARALRNQFWKRWVLEYLPTLTRRVKWCERTDPIKEGDVVFVCDPNLPRSQWRRGRVVHVYCGADGVARRAEVNTASGVIQRPVSRLAVLDVTNGEADRSTGAGMSRTTLQCSIPS